MLEQPRKEASMGALKASTFAIVLGAIVLPALAQAPARPKPAPRTAAKCAAPEYRQLDFWVGDWDAYDLADANKRVARNRVDLSATWPQLTCFLQHHSPQSPTAFLSNLLTAPAR
jgi:hypothetical protein